MKILFYSGIDILGFGFLIGFTIILITYLTAYFSGKHLPGIKKSLVIIGALLLIMYTPPIEGISRIWLIISLLFLTYLLSNIIKTLFSIINNFYNGHLKYDRVNKLPQILYLFAIVIGIALVLLGSWSVIAFSYYLIKQIILLLIGIWAALWLLYKEKPFEDKINHP